MYLYIEKSVHGVLGFADVFEIARDAAAL